MTTTWTVSGLCAVQDEAAAIRSLPYADVAVNRCLAHLWASTGLDHPCDDAEIEANVAETMAKIAAAGDEWEGGHFASAAECRAWHLSIVLQKRGN